NSRHGTAALPSRSVRELRRAPVPSWMPQCYPTRCGSESRGPVTLSLAAEPTEPAARADSRIVAADVRSIWRVLWDALFAARHLELLFSAWPLIWLYEERVFGGGALERRF